MIAARPRVVPGLVAGALTAMTLLGTIPAEAQEPTFGDVLRDGQGARHVLLMPCLGCDAIVANGDTFGFDEQARHAWADAEMTDVLARYDSDTAWTRLNRAPRTMSPERGAFYERMWLRPPREHVFAYWRDWLRTDAGALLPTLEIPFLAIHALPEDSARAASTRADLEARYRRAPMPVGGRVVYVENSGHTIWEYRPDAFDRALAEFVLGTATQLLPTDR